MGTEKAKTVLDKALQRCQEFPYKDWSSAHVVQLIKDTKAALNDEEEQGRCRGRQGRRTEVAGGAPQGDAGNWDT